MLEALCNGSHLQSPNEEALRPRPSARGERRHLERVTPLHSCRALPQRRDRRV